MPRFKYSAINFQTNQKETIVIAAASEAEANDLITSKGFRPLSVKEIKENNFSLGAIFNRLSRKDKLFFVSQLSTLIGAGLPLLQSFQSVRTKTKNSRLLAITDDLITSLEAGIAFSTTLKKYPKVFDQVFVSLIQSGEASGTLDVSLDRLAVQQEKDAEVASRIKGAMIYPAITVFVMIAVVVFMLVFVLPQVQNFYANIDNPPPMPLLTRVLLSVSDALKAWQTWLIAIPVVIGISVGARKWLATEQGRKVKDSIKLNFPLFKNLFAKVYMARFCRTLGTLFSSGVNMVESLNIIQNGINNHYIEEGIAATSQEVQTGVPLSVSIAKQRYFLDLVPDMIAIGEQSGKTEEMLLKAAVYYEKEVNKEVDALTKAMEPIMIICLGGVALLIMLAVLLPIFNLIQQNKVAFELLIS